jgi:hypothetical protein
MSLISATFDEAFDNPGQLHALIRRNFAHGYRLGYRCDCGQRILR